MTQEQRLARMIELVPAAAPILARMQELRAAIDASGGLSAHNQAQIAYNNYVKLANADPAMVELAGHIRAGRLQ